MPTGPAVGEPRHHLVPELRGMRVVRWLMVALGAYNVAVALVDGGWVRAGVWVVLSGVLVAINVMPRRVGTRVEHQGLRRGWGWRWGRLVPWADVVGVRVAGPYDDASRVELRGGRDVPLHGMSADDVRALAREHGLPVRDPSRPRAASSPGERASGVGDLEGPFRRGR